MPPKAPYETRLSLGELRAGDGDLADTYAGPFAAFWAVDDYATAFAPGAFRKTLGDRRGRLAMFWFHDPTQVVGPILEAKEDKQTGGPTHRTRAVGDLGRMVLDNLRAGADAEVSHLGTSFGFWRLKDRSAEDDDPLDLTTGPRGVKRDDVRVITEVQVDEVSTLPWTFAAQPKAVITDVRARAQQADVLTSLLAELRAGTLPDEDERRALVAQIVAAWGDGAAPPSDEPPARTPAEARREPDFALLAAVRLARARLVLSGESP